MVRKIIEIDREKCNGCGLCAEACHEGAIGMKNGKAELLRDDYCDGLGDCLPVCPTGAISFVEREAAGYDEEKVMAAKRQKADKLPCGCPGTQSKKIERAVCERGETKEKTQSELSQWPVQIRLVPVNAPYFDGADLLVAADCTAYAYGSFHADFIRGRVTIIGCPKLDSEDYSDKLTEILRKNNIRSVTVARMEVPCCGGLANAAVTALQNCGKMIPWQIVTIGTDGQIKDGRV